MKISLLAPLALLLFTACPGDPCDEKAGSVLCGYCNEDRAATGNPHAGMCRYCASGTTCTGSICGDLACVAPGGGGGGGNTCPGSTCISNLCSPGLWCCAVGRSCNTGACGCN